MFPMFQRHQKEISVHEVQLWHVCCTYQEQFIPLCKEIKTFHKHSLVFYVNSALKRGS